VEPLSSYMPLKSSEALPPRTRTRRKEEEEKKEMEKEEQKKKKSFTPRSIHSLERFVVGL